MSVCRKSHTGVICTNEKTNGFALNPWATMVMFVILKASDPMIASSSVMMMLATVSGTKRMVRTNLLSHVACILTRMFDLRNMRSNRRRYITKITAVLFSWRNITFAPVPGYIASIRITNQSITLHKARQRPVSI